MSSPSAVVAERRISLVDSLRGEWLKIVGAVMQDAGPAAHTFAGLLRITDSKTFVSAETIAKRARLPLRTCNRHLAALNEQGWIDNLGREKTRGGIPRRTCTIAVTEKSRDMMAPWYPLPWWACCEVSGLTPLP